MAFGIYDHEHEDSLLCHETELPCKGGDVDDTGIPENCIPLDPKTLNLKPKR